MKYVVLVPDGAADYSLEELDGKTPLQFANTPNMDRLAEEGLNGLVQMIPATCHPGSDIGNLEIFGYDSTVHYSGRAPLEAASMGIELGDADIAFRCNLINRDGDTLVDYSAGHITTEEGAELVQSLAAGLANSEITFYPGVGYRHIMVFRGGPARQESHPPHDIMGQSIAANLPRGDGQQKIRDLMQAAEPILNAAEVNQKRRRDGQLPASAIWLWGSGKSLRLDTFERKHGICGGVISAVDLVRGIGRQAGLEVIEVPGITGYLDTNYAGKASYALDALRQRDLVYVHVEAPDEAGHNGDAGAKIQALEDFDRMVAGPVAGGLAKYPEARILMTPDHRTPVPLRTHSREPVPFVLWGTGFAADGVDAYDEESAEGGIAVERGHMLMQYLMGMATPDLQSGS